MPESKLINGYLHMPWRNNSIFIVQAADSENRDGFPRKTNQATERT